MKEETKKFIEKTKLNLHSPMEGYLIPYSRLGYLLEQYNQEQAAPVSLDEQSETAVCIDCGGKQFVYYRKKKEDVCINCWEKQTEN